MEEGGCMGIYVYIYLIHFVIQQKLRNNVKQLYSNKDVKKKKKKKCITASIQATVNRM